MTDQQNEIKLEREFAEAYVPVREYTMLDWERCYSVWNSLNYVLNAGIPGALVECGVWKGGICMLMANSLRAQGVTDRDLYLTQ